MKNFKSLFALLALLLGTVTASAYDTETKTPYSYDFNLSNYSSTTTLESEWAPPGWGHFVDSFVNWGTTYTVPYDYLPTMGVDGSGAIRIGSQSLGGWYSSYTANDMLITPLVSGQVTLKVEGNTDGGSITFNNVTEADGNYTIGTEISDTTMTGAISTEGDFITVSFDAGTEPKHVGIRGNNVIIDNFTAASATLELKPALKFQGVRQVSSEVADADADGNFDVEFKAYVINNGLVDLNPGDEGYSLSLIKASDGTVVKDVPIDVALKQGEGDSIDVKATLNVSDYPAGSKYDFQLRENESNTVVGAGTASPVEYKPQFAIREADNGGNLVDSATVDYGKTKSAITKKFVITNDGAKQLVVNSITAPDGYTVTPANLTLAAHKSDSVSVTLDNAVVGTKDGYVTFDLDEIPDFALHVTGTVLDSTKWFVDFEDNKIPDNMIHEGENWAVNNYPQQVGLSNNNYSLYQDQYGSANDHLISPKLHVAAGESLQFDAARGAYEATTPVLNVYYSTDRHNWTLAQTISADQEDPAYQFSTERTGAGYYSYYKFKTFTISNIPEGDYYVAFAGSYFYLDNIYGFTEVPVSHDIMLSSLKAPESISVNSKSEFTVSATNATAKNEDAGSYTITLHVGDNTYNAEATALAAATSNSYKFDVTPHQDGTYPAYVLYETPDGYVASSDTVDVTIDAETASASHQVGTPDQSSASQNGLINIYYKYNQTVAVYTPEQLNLPAGTVIRGLSLHGYSQDSRNADVRIYFRNTDKTSIDGSAASTEIADTANFTRVYAGNTTIAKGGEASGSYSSTRMTKADELFHVSFAEPYVYNGGNLEVATNSYASNWVTALWEAAAISGQAAAASDDYPLTGGKFGGINLPVIYLDIDRNPDVVSGVVTSKTTSQPVEGATVKFVNGDVEYSTTTDAEGKYSVNVIKDEIPYQLQVTKAGFTPVFSDSLTVSKDTTINVSLADASGFYVISKNIPAKGEVNSAFAATAKAINTEAATAGASDYTATLYFNDEAVAKATTADVAAGESADFKFAFTPHKAGTFKAYVKFVDGDKVTVSDSTDVTIGEESATELVQVNTPNEVSTNLPYMFYYNHSQSETVYKASQLGLAKGAKIRSITFRGYNSANSVAPSISAYIANTTDDNVQSVDKSFVNTDEMQTIVKDSVFTGLQEAHGSPNDQHHDLIKLEIPGGFTYTGGNIRLAFSHDENGYFQAYFDVDNTVDQNQTVVRYQDYTLDNANFAHAYQPVLYLEIETEGKVSGKVVNSRNEAVANAVVSLTNGDVLYSDTTDAEGNYDISVKKLDRNYDVTVSANGYFDDVKAAAVSFADSSDIVLNDTLTKVAVVAGTVKGISNKAGATAQPLAGAKVTVSDADGAEIATLTTAADGTYTVDSLTEAKSYTLKFEAEGYNDSTADVTAAFDTVKVNPVLRSQYISATGTVLGTDMKSDGTFFTEPLAGATVTVTDSEGNTFTATTAADGTYAIDSLLENGTYTFSFTADAYVAKDTTVEAESSDLVVDITLVSEAATGIDGISVDKQHKATGNVYNLAGKLVGRNVNLSELPRGVYIIDGKKITVK